MTPTKTNKTNTNNQTHKPKPFTKGTADKPKPFTKGTKVLSYGRRFYGRSSLFGTALYSLPSCGFSNTYSIRKTFEFERRYKSPLWQIPTSRAGKIYCPPPPHATKALPKTLRVTQSVPVWQKEKKPYLHTPDTKSYLHTSIYVLESLLHLDRF